MEKFFVFIAFVLIVSVSCEVDQLTEDEVRDLKRAYSNPNIESRFGEIFSGLGDKIQGLTLKHFKVVGLGIGQHMCKSLNEYVSKEKSKGNVILDE